MKIISVNYLNDYKLEIHFSNNDVKVCDFETFLRSSKNISINKFLNKKLFKKVIIDSGFLSWNNGEMEISAFSAFKEFAINEVFA